MPYFALSVISTAGRNPFRFLTSFGMTETEKTHFMQVMSINFDYVLAEFQFINNINRIRRVSA